MGRTRIRFYENGVISYNLPIAGQVIGSQATRTTHPRAIRGMAKFLSVLLGDDFSVKNPFTWKTKSEVARLVAKLGHAGLIRHSVSCSRVRSMTTLHPHCGTCFQCIDRRFGALAAGLDHDDPPEMYRIDLLTGPREAGVDRTMAEAYVRRALEFRRITQAGFISQCIGEISRGMSAFPGVGADAIAARTFELHRRHGESVHSVLT
jgi:Queuosine biosynthesis protein QueC